MLQYHFPKFEIPIIFANGQLIEIKKITKITFLNYKSKYLFLFFYLDNRESVKFAEEESIHLISYYLVPIFKNDVNHLKYFIRFETVHKFDTK